MKNEPRGQFAKPANRKGDASTSKQRPLRIGRSLAALAVSLFCCGVATADDGDSPIQLRRFIDGQVAGIEKLMVPADDANLPQARLPDGTDASADPRFKTTETKRYLGKQLFHDPIRTARIVPQFGGVLATKQTGSCGSCHQGESASKAGTLLNFSVGGEGRSYTDAKGTFIPRRRPQMDILPKLRDRPLFPGDALVDELPTLTDVYAIAGAAGPFRGRKLPDPGALLRTGRAGCLGQRRAQCAGCARSRLQQPRLAGGLAGEPDSSPGGLNPFNFP